MKNVKKLCFLFAVMCFWTGSLFAAETGLKPLDIKMNIVAGQVKVMHGKAGDPQVVSVPCSLYEEDVIETLHESKAELAYPDGTIMRLKPLARVQVRANSLMVEKGQTWYKFTKRGTEFVIETHSLVAGIRGTEFEVTVDSRGKTMLTVISGAVGVKGASGKEVLVNSGFSTSCKVGGNPVAPIHFNVEKLKAQWNDAKWVADDNIDQLYMRYSECNSKYGENDPRTISAKESLSRALNKKSGK